MYNHLRRCLTISMKIHKKLLMQKSSHESILPFVIDCYASSHCIWNNMICKRFYCQINEKIDRPGVMKSDAQRLEELISNPKEKKRYQILELEMDLLRHNGANAPAKLNPSQWLLLLKLPTRRQRRIYLSHVSKNENYKKDRKQHKELKTARWLAKKAKAEAEAKQIKDTGKIIYGLSDNSMFRRINVTTMNHYYNAKLIQAMMFAPKVVFDCSYENYMNAFEIHKCARQLTLAFANNRIHVDPLCLYYCNLNKDGFLMKRFNDNIPTLLSDDFPAIVTSQSYLDFFRRDQLLYLTPYCKNDITEYNSDTVYIIGAISKKNTEPLSLAKAKKNGIRMGKLPIEKYLEWDSGSCKTFTVDQMINILLDLRYTGDWKKALQHVTKITAERKLKEFRDYKSQKKLNRSHLKNMETQERFTMKRSTIKTDFTFNCRKFIIHHKR